MRNTQHRFTWSLVITPTRVQENVHHNEFLFFNFCETNLYIKAQRNNQLLLSETSKKPQEFKPFSSRNLVYGSVIPSSVTIGLDGTKRKSKIIVGLTIMAQY